MNSDAAGAIERDRNTKNYRIVLPDVFRKGLAVLNWIMPLSQSGCFDPKSEASPS